VSEELGEIIDIGTTQIVVAKKDKDGFAVPAERIIKNLSFSHIVELIKITDPLQ
jgi:hypothetical protein